jgi:hypothetical protein
LVIYFSNVTRAGTFKTLLPTTAFQELFTPTSVPFTVQTGSPPDEPVTTANRRGYVISYDYEGIVKEWINNPSSNTGIAIVGDATLSATISSREGAATGAAAFLEIDVNPTEGAVGATTLGVTGDATVGGSLATTGDTTISGNLGVGTAPSASFKLNVGGPLNTGALTGTTGTFSGNVLFNGSVGIGALDPSAAVFNIFSATSNRRMKVETGSNTQFAGYDAKTPTSNWYMGTETAPSRDWVLFDSNASANRVIVSGAAATLGNVGIGLAPLVGFKLAVAGQVIANGTVLSSDARFKKDITSITLGLDTVKKLRPVTYDWRRDEFPDRNFDAGNHSGFIAQEIGQVLPNVVTEIGGGYKAVNYVEVIPVLTRAIQELAEAKDAEIAALKEKIAALEARAVARVTLDAELEARLARLEAASGAAAPVKAVTTAFTGKE